MILGIAKPALYTLISSSLDLEHKTNAMRCCNHKEEQTWTLVTIVLYAPDFVRQCHSIDDHVSAWIIVLGQISELKTTSSTPVHSQENWLKVSAHRQFSRTLIQLSEASLQIERHVPHLSILSPMFDTYPLCNQRNVIALTSNRNPNSCGPIKQLLHSMLPSVMPPSKSSVRRYSKR